MTKMNNKILNIVKLGSYQKHWNEHYMIGVFGVIITNMFHIHNLYYWNFEEEKNSSFDFFHYKSYDSLQYKIGILWTIFLH